MGYDAEGKALGTPARIQTIYETNMAVAAARGHWQRMSEARDVAPYLRYTAMMGGNVPPRLVFTSRWILELLCQIPMPCRRRVSGRVIWTGFEITYRSARGCAVRPPL